MRARRRGRLLMAGLVLLIGVIAAIDFVTGMAVVISALYFIPIIAAGWLLRPTRAMAVAAIAALAWIGADVA